MSEAKPKWIKVIEPDCMVDCMNCGGLGVVPVQDNAVILTPMVCPGCDGTRQQKVLKIEPGR